MRAMITRLLVVYPLLATFGMAAVVLGLRQPPSARGDRLRLNECELACWIGSLPGQTAIEEAERRVEQAFGDGSRYEVEKEAFPGRWATYHITDRRGGETMGIYLDTR